MLDTCVVDQNIDSSEFFQGLIHNFFAISSLGQIGKDIDRLGCGILCFKIFDGCFNLLVGSKSIKNDVVPLSSQSVCDSQADSTE